MTYFSTYGKITVDNYKEVKTMPAGKPRHFRSESDFLDLWCEFCAEIERDGYDKAPTFSEFRKWLADHFKSTDAKTIYNALHEYFPNIKKEVEEIRADVVAQGTMLGIYQPTMSIFALKNWCGWADKVENMNTNYEVEIDFGKIDED